MLVSGEVFSRIEADLALVAGEGFLRVLAVGFFFLQADFALFFQLRIRVRQHISDSKNYLIDQFELFALALLLRSCFLDRFHIGMTAFAVVLLVNFENLKFLECDVAFCAEKLPLFLFGGHCFAFQFWPFARR